MLANAAWFGAGLLLLVLGAEWLVRGGARLAGAAGVSPLVVGLTVVAFGTSAPEFAVSLGASLRGQGDIAFGNAVGSNIFNVLFVLGASALLTPLTVARQLVRLDVPVMIVACGLVPLLGLDGRLGRLDGLLLAGGLAGYIAWSIRVSRAEARPVAAEEARAAGLAGLLRSAALVVVGLGLLVLGARWLVSASIAVAQALGVSELVIGLTVVAIGTSLPEAATSLVAAARGQRDIAVGNVVGSNIFNMLGVLGLSAAASPDGVGAAPEAMRFDVPVMVAAAAACLPIFAHARIERWQGALFLANYAAYTAYVVLASSQHPARATFGWLMLVVALPLTAGLLAFVSWRALRARSRGDV